MCNGGGEIRTPVLACHPTTSTSLVPAHFVVGISVQQQTWFQPSQLYFPFAPLTLASVSPYCYKHPNVKSGTFEACTFLLPKQRERILHLRSILRLCLQLVCFASFRSWRSACGPRPDLRQSKPNTPPFGIKSFRGQFKYTIT